MQTHGEHMDLCRQSVTAARDQDRRGEWGSGGDRPLSCFSAPQEQTQAQSWQISHESLPSEGSYMVSRSRFSLSGCILYFHLISILPYYTLALVFPLFNDFSERLIRELGPHWQHHTVDSYLVWFIHGVDSLSHHTLRVILLWNFVTDVMFGCNCLGYMQSHRMWHEEVKGIYSQYVQRRWEVGFSEFMVQQYLEDKYKLRLFS